MVNPFFTVEAAIASVNQLFPQVHIRDYETMQTLPSALR